MVRIACKTCHKPLQIDETKLPPNQPVNFACPHCKSPMTVDRRELGAEAAPNPPQQPAGANASMSRDDDDHEQHQLGEKALIVGADSPAIRQAIKAIGLNPVYFAAVDAARDYFVREYPSVVFFNPAQLTPPPLTDFGSILGVSPMDRRKGFFVLVADNLRTFDGNAAFLYGMNLIVASKDLPSFPQIYSEADQFHKRLYASMNAVQSRH